MEIDFNSYKHLIPGYSARSSIVNAFRIKLSQTIALGDPISIGPQLLSGDPNETLVLRHNYFGNNLSLPEDEMRLFTIGDCHKAFADINSDEKIIFWLDGTNDNQLILAMLCSWIKQEKTKLSKLYVIELKSCEEYFTYPCQSILTPEKLQNALWDFRELSKEELSLRASIWQAFCETNPLQQISKLSQLELNKNSRGAIDTLIHRYPSKKNGLTHIQNIILQSAIKYEPYTIRTIVDALDYWDNPDHCGDTHVFDTMLEMGAKELNFPLFYFNSHTDAARHTWHGVLPIGHEILAGKKNMIELNGINQWIGGVHLTKENFIYKEDLLEQLSQ